MSDVRTKLAVVLLGGGLLVGLAGGCLPDNFLVNLAGDVVETTVNTVLEQFLADLLNPSSAG